MSWKWIEEILLQLQENQIKEKKIQSQNNFKWKIAHLI